jgi:ABC-type oligopeptide transport system substrate-binding subunit
MRRRKDSVAIVALALVAAVTLAACGKSKKTSSGAAAKAGSAVTITFGTAPDSLDPGASETTQAAEPGDVVYIPLYTYAAANGVAGTKLIRPTARRTRSRCAAD